MYTIRTEQKEAILNLLVEGSSIRSIERLTGVHRDTIVRLLWRIGERCERFMAERLTGLHCEYLECDEIWTFVARKRRADTGHTDPDLGEQFIFVAMDRDTKIVPAFTVGKRNAINTVAFLMQLRERVTGIPHISTDQWPGYETAVDEVFGEEARHGTLRKMYWHPRQARRKITPCACKCAALLA